MKRVMLFPNPARDPGFAGTLALAKMLRACGYAPVLGCRAEPMPEDLNYQAPEDGLEGIDLIVCLGGDGTILRVAADAARADRPILGVNLGRRGFLAAMEQEELPELCALLDGGFAEDHRTMLSVELWREDRCVQRLLALNDLVISATEMTHVIHLSVWDGAEKITNMDGDGLIVASPTGSTAHAYSAGGPILAPGLDAMLLVPICPVGPFSRPIALPAERSIHIDVETTDRALYCTADGLPGVRLRHGDRLTIRRAKESCRLLRKKDYCFYRSVHDKLM